ncbi:MAG: hypothetical protein WA474_05430 [Candidatus Sulfotelmatobacter sp.]
MKKSTTSTFMAASSCMFRSTRVAWIVAPPDVVGKLMDSWESRAE